MSDPALIADLVRAGLDPELVGRVANALSTRMSGGSPVESPVDDAAERRRTWDREYRRKLRDAKKASTRNPPETGGNPPEIHPTKVDNGRTLLTILSSSEGGNREENKKVKRDARETKGTRMSTGCPLSDADRNFALDEGFDKASVQRMWVEFVDYWIGVSGKAGIKLDWSGTWRNRVRAIKDRKGAGNGNGSHGNRTFQAPRHPPTGADAILAGVARNAARRGLIKPPDEPEDGEVRRRFNLAGGSDAE